VDCYDSLPFFEDTSVVTTTIVASKKGKLSHPTRTSRTYLAILKACAHATLAYDTLTGTDRFSWRRTKQAGSRRTP
jgi:hypothetical protein